MSGLIGPTATAAVLIERDREVAEIRCSAERLRAVATGPGAGEILMVRGPAGIGKSALLSHLRDEVGPSTTVLHARGSELERDVGWGVVRQLLEPWLRTLPPDRATRVFDGPAAAARTLFAPAPALPPSVGGSSLEGTPPDTFALLHSLTWLVSDAAEWSPIALVVDDLMWIDPESAQFLEYLAHRLDGVRLLLVGASRPSADPCPGWRQSALYREITVAPLSPKGTAAFVRQASGWVLDPDEVEAWHRATGGVPFHVESLLRSLPAHRPPTPLEIREVAPELVVPRLVGTTQTPERLALARALAVLDADPSLEVAAEVAGLPVERCGCLVEGLRSDGVVAPERLALAHPILRAAVLDDLGQADRPAWHRRCAQALAATRADLDHVATHLLHTGSAPDQWSSNLLAKAGREAARRSAPRLAVTYLDRAHDLHPDPCPIELEFDLGVARLRAGATTAREPLQRAVEGGSGEPWWPVAVRSLGQSFAFNGDPACAVDLLAGHESTVSDLAARLELTADRFYYLQLTDRIDEAVEVGEGLLRALDEIGSPSRGLVRAARALIGVHRNEPAAPLAAAAKAGWVEAAYADADVHHRADAVLTMILCGDVVDAGVAAEDLRRTASQSGDRAGIAIAAQLHALAYASRGMLREAEAEARDAIDHGAAALPLTVPVAWSVLVEVMLAQSGASALPELTAMMPALGSLPVGPADYARIGSGRLAAARGDMASAEAWLRGCGAELARRGGVGIAQFPWRPLSVPVLLAVDRADEARALAAEAVGLAEVFGAAQPLTQTLLTAALASADAEERLSLTQRAWACVEHSPHLLDRARAALALGDLLAGVDPQAARHYLGVALDGADRCGAGGVREAAYASLRRLGARPRRARADGPGSLTAAELRVARLAASGMSNREIAAHLFLTVKTVEIHLTKTYRKLSVRGRADLAGALGDLG